MYDKIKLVYYFMNMETRQQWTYTADTPTLSKLQGDFIELLLN